MTESEEKRRRHNYPSCKYNPEKQIHPKAKIS
jgi:hypothetical protein